MTTKLIGFTGEIASGKTTAARIMHEVAGVQGTHLEFSDQVIDFANQFLARIPEDDEDIPGIADTLLVLLNEVRGKNVPQNLAAQLSLDGLVAYLELRRKIPIPDRQISVDNKSTHRPLLQWLGHEMVVHVDKHFWSRTMELAIIREKRLGRELITVGGVRYSMDAQTVHAHQGLVVAVIRRGSQDDLQKHISEAGISGELIDTRLENSGDLDVFTSKVTDLWKDLQVSVVKEEY